MKLNQIAENNIQSSFTPGWYEIDGIELPKINPDSFHMKEGNITFIYYNDELVWEEDWGNDISHYDLIDMNADFFGYNLHSAGRQSAIGTIRADMEEWALIGRVSPDKQFVTFWNEPDQLHDELGKCISELLSQNLIYPNTNVVLFGFDQTTEASNTKNMGNPETQTRVDPEKAKRDKLRRELHLMKPQQKKAAMKELGLIGGGHKQPWQQAAEQNQLVSPGQKWWAPTSESKKG